MQPTDLLYINLLKNTDAKEATSTVLTPEEQQTISALALRHYTSPLLLPYINEPQLHEQLKQQTKQMILNYHQIAHFTFLVTSLLDDHQIPYIKRDQSGRLLPAAGIPQTWRCRYLYQ